MRKKAVIKKCLMRVFVLMLAAFTFVYAPTVEAIDNIYFSTDQMPVFKGSNLPNLTFYVENGTSALISYRDDTDTYYIDIARDITIVGDGMPVTNRIILYDNGNDAKITLRNVNIDVSAYGDCAFMIVDEGGYANPNTIVLEGNNSLISGGGYSGIQKVSSGSGTLTITGSGSLNAVGGDGAAGIGAGVGEIANSIDIQNSNINGTVQNGDWCVALSLNSAVVTGYFGSDESVTLSDFWGYTVTAIGENAFANNTAIKNLIVPDSVTAIGDGAFSGCVGLTVNYGGFIYKISDSTASIAGCSQGGNVVIPSNFCGLPITAIDEGAFSGNTGLTSVTVSDCITAIGDNAFSDCISLSAVTIPTSVVSIGSGAFSNCTGLTDITIPDNVTSIGDGAFFGCTNLTIHCNEYSTADNYLKNYPEIKADITHVHRYSTAWNYDDTYHWSECKCGDRINESVHTEDGAVTTEPTHTESGVMTYTCTACDYSRIEEIPAIGHTFDKKWDYDSTSHWHECECGEKSDVTVHAADSGIVTTEPTETAVGVIASICTVCDYRWTEEIPVKEHVHLYSETWDYDSTSHWHECSCGEKSEVTAHISDGGIITTEPTHIESGIMTYTCTACGYCRTEDIPALGHTFGGEWKCDAASHWHECECGDKTDIAQHVYDSGIVTVQPTATTIGVKKYSCTVCGYVLGTETIPATGYIDYPSYPAYPTYTPVTTAPSVFSEKLSVKAEVGSSTVKLNWDEIKNADKYIVYQYKNGKYVKIKTTADTLVTFKKLKNGETYKYFVRYTINGRLSPTTYSGKITVKVNYKPLPKATAAKNSIKLTWEAVPEAKKYAVYKYIDGKAVKLAETKKLSVKISKLSPDTEYKYIVRAYVDGKWSAMLKSDIVTVKTKAE